MQEEVAAAAVAFSNYLLGQGFSENTTQTYVWNLNIFSRYCGNAGTSAACADRSIVEGFLAEQIRRHTRSTAHVRLATVKQYFAWEMTRGTRQDNPAKLLRVRAERLKAKPPCTKPQMEAMMGAAKGEAERLLIEVAASCGLRIGELARINLQDIDPERGTLLVHGKGSKQRLVAPPGVILDRLHTLGVHNPGPSVWPLADSHARRIIQIRTIMGRIARHAGVTAFYPHRLRITFANEFWADTHDLLSLQILMGHASSDQTAHYAGYSAQAAALDQMRGRNS